MRGRFLALMLTIGLATLVSCHTTKQPTTVRASIAGTYWKLVMLNGKAVPSVGQSAKEPHMMLSASDNKVNGTGGCNSFFGTYQLQGENGITFSPIGATKMACQDNVMAVEHQLFQALEMTSKFSLSNDTLILTTTDMSPLAKFIVDSTK